MPLISLWIYFFVLPASHIRFFPFSFLFVFVHRDSCMRVHTCKWKIACFFFAFFLSLFANRWCKQTNIQKWFLCVFAGGISRRYSHKNALSHRKRESKLYDVCVCIYVFKLGMWNANTLNLLKFAYSFVHSFVHSFLFVVVVVVVCVCKCDEGTFTHTHSLPLSFICWINNEQCAIFVRRWMMKCACVYVDEESFVRLDSHVTTLSRAQVMCIRRRAHRTLPSTSTSHIYMYS